jgi:hypothetical protein
MNGKMTKCFNILMSQNFYLKKSVVIKKCSADFKMRRGTKNQRKVGRNV